MKQALVMHGGCAAITVEEETIRAAASTGLIAIDAGGAIVTIRSTRFMATARRGAATGMRL